MNIKEQLIDIESKIIEAYKIKGNFFDREQYIDKLFEQKRILTSKLCQKKWKKL